MPSFFLARNLVLSQPASNGRLLLRVLSACAKDPYF